ncbi:MAG: chromosome segregation protein SMC [Candidatus Ancaeobacter aquaticus]|nr:chromosome segregation protein SMC [Candidatus Ancaeobacter aquaticus]
MYFKRIEIAGFKSFLGKTVLDFEPGIAVIVGPNGCGKSNISDAIRWVIGEQSAKLLRGARMEDVIFNGADDKKPLSMAEASITLADCDKDLPLGYNEITVTRRIYRSGEGEYFINKTPCRLKDINELFMGTGVGKQAYSIIEQGKIGQILSTKPEERRHIFEEAAGITKYKSRKREALRKIEHTEENLIRLNDIIKEVKRQINSINRYAKKAHEYKSVYDELKELDIHYNYYKYFELKAAADETAKQITLIKENESQHTSRIRELEEASDKVRQDLDVLEQSIMSFENDRLSTSEAINQTESEITLHEERVRDLKLLEENALKEIEALKENLGQFEAQQKGSEEEYTRIKESNVALKTIIKEKHEQIHAYSTRIKEKEMELAKNKEESFEMLSVETRTRNEFSNFQMEKKNVSLRKEKLHVEKNEIIDQCESIDAEFTALKTTIDEEEISTRSLRESIHALTHTQNTISEDVKQHTEKIQHLKEQLSEKRADLKLLNELKERFEGYDTGVRSILETCTQGTANGIIGPIADFIEIKPGYELPVQLALSQDMQDILTDDIDSIKDHISYLKEHGSGRASFIPFIDFKYRINTETKKDTFEHLLHNPSVKGFVADFIQCKTTFKDIIEFLFKDTLVVDTFDSALKLIKHENFNCNIVTLTGEMIDKNGIVRGGSIPKEELEILKRDNDIESLIKTIQTLENDIENNSALKDKEELELKKIVDDITVQREKLRESEVLLGTKKNDFDKVRSQKERLQDHHTVIVSEIKELFSEDEKVTQEIEKLNTLLNEKEQANVTLKVNLSDIEATLTEINREKDELAEEMTRYKIDLASSEEKEFNTQAGLGRIIEDLASKNALLTSRTQDCASYNEKQIEFTHSIEAAKNKLSSLTVKKEGIEKYLEETKIKKRSFINELSEIEEEQKELRSLLTSYSEKRMQHEIKISETKMHLSAMIEHVRKDYHIALDEVSLSLEENTDWTAVEERIEELKAILEKIGPVNLAAIEENEELEKRHAFMVKQHEDLVKAKETLMKVISKINSTTRKLFIDTFTQVRTNFQEMFVHLFGGGKADLILGDESDILETGIEIIARPPGKKLQNISLLSGGEKALTAVSLLFAIFKVKPSPFCVLDEIDAPLDESNIGRFTDVLKDFAKESQFIVITHNKKTISSADIMYGITMEQMGVSKVVSVRFSPKRDKAEKEVQETLPIEGVQKPLRHELRYDDDLSSIDKELNIEIKEPLSQTTDLSQQTSDVRPETTDTVPQTSDSIPQTTDVRPETTD